MTRLFGPILGALIAILIFGLHSVKIDATRSAEELVKVQQDILDERKALQILTAEWSHLNQPGKLQRMSETYLELEAVRTTQIVALDDLPYLKLDLFDGSDGQHKVTYPQKPIPRPELLVEISSDNDGGVYE
jgi:hypothetical protein